mmetsp:Transcript_12383/g.26757  ORF Transcript_12383/g.26757 Transcript_12383/m.26757 type:complete len:410 (-) Transcript_12383:146-1375(-)
MRAFLVLLFFLSASASRLPLQLQLRRSEPLPETAQQSPVRPLSPRRQPMPPQRGPVPMQPVNGSSTLSTLLIALGTNWLVYERFSALAIRVCRNAFRTLTSWCTRVANYPPRAVVVHLKGIIATEDEVKYGDSRAMLLAPELAPADPEAGDSRPQVRGDLINLARFEKTLSRAFATPGARAVAILIDSPGGSPAQSSLLYHRLRALRTRYPRVKLLAFVEDSAASGGYYIACAADEIIVDANSIVGSIGVISRGFGYVQALRKKGVERRVFTAGESKGGVDPYLPIRSKALAKQKRLLGELHSNFIAAVREGRGDRLKPEAAARLSYSTTAWAPSFMPSNATIRRLVTDGAGLFDGSVYSGTTAAELGLVDLVGEMRFELQRRYGRSVRISRLEPEAPIDYSRLLRWLL